MRRNRCAKLALLLAVALIACCACPIISPAALELLFPQELALPSGFVGAALATGSGGEVYVENETLLGNWLADNSSGTVYLKNDITLTTYKVYKGSVTINTGSNSLIYNGGFLHAESDSASITIIGEGVKHPVLDVQRIPYSGWNSFLFPLTVTATGDKNDNGGTAMRINAIDTQSWNSNVTRDNDVWGRWPGRITASGDGAVGLEVIGSFKNGLPNIVFFDIVVNGDNSTAVLSSTGANICFSSLSATGDKAQAIRGGGEFLVDTCLVEPPLTPDASIQVYQAYLMSRWFPVKQGHVQVPSQLPAVEWNGGGSLVNKFRLAAHWDQAYDFSTAFDDLGKIPVQHELAAPWLRQFFSDAPSLLIDVRDPALPCIFDVEMMNNGLCLVFWPCLDIDIGLDSSDAAEPGTYRLLRSMDSGVTWEDCTEEDGFEISKSDGDYDVLIPYDKVEEDMMFLVELPGAGRSNVAHFSSAYDISYSSGITGGDRVGTDRIPVSLLNEAPEIPAGGEQDGNTGILPGVGSGFPLFLAPASTPTVTPEIAPPQQPDAGSTAQTGGDAPGQSGGGASGGASSQGDSTQPGGGVPLSPPAQNDPAQAGGATAPIGGPATLEAPVAPANNLAPSFVEPAAQPALPTRGRNGVAAAIAASGAAAVLAGGGWLWLRARRLARRQ